MKTTCKTNKTLKNKQKYQRRRLKWPSRPEVYDAFSQWLIYPKSIRTPKNQQGFAKLHEISQNSLSSYKKRAGFWEKVAENRQKLKDEIENNLELDRIFKNIENKNL